jgi:cardiolipin synthase
MSSNGDAPLPFHIPAPIVAEDISGHHIEVITSGRQRLEKLVSLIDGAQHSIDLVMYIYADDVAGRKVGAAMVAAAQRGVKVRAVIDSFGSSNLRDDFYDPLREAGGKICFFSRRWASSYLIRNHQKLILIDGHICMSGGFNIADSYFQDGHDEDWLDLGLVITGPSIIRIRRWCRQVFAYAEHYDGKLLILRKLIKRWPISRGPVAWLVGGPTERLSPWSRTLKRDLRRAQRLDMAMAYFSPGHGMLRRLGRIAKLGKARFIMSGKSDNAATIGASRLLYNHLLKRGARIAEFGVSRFHMKLIVIDDITYIGTANFDVRSLFLNVEMMLRVADAGFAAQMRGLIGEVERASVPVTVESHRRRAGFFTRLRWTMAWLVVGVIDYTVSRRLNFGLRDDPSDAEY